MSYSYYSSNQMLMFNEQKHSEPLMKYYFKNCYLILLICKGKELSELQTHRHTEKQHLQLQF